jgi:hypothetical protein
VRSRTELLREPEGMGDRCTVVSKRCCSCRINNVNKCSQLNIYIYIYINSKYRKRKMHICNQELGVKTPKLVDMNGVRYVSAVKSYKSVRGRSCNSLDDVWPFLWSCQLVDTILASLPFQYHITDHKETFLNVFVVVPL